MIYLAFEFGCRRVIFALALNPHLWVWIEHNCRWVGRHLVSAEWWCGPFSVTYEVHEDEQYDMALNDIFSGFDAQSAHAKETAHGADGETGLPDRP